MLGVTVFGIFFTPVFYVVIRWFTQEESRTCTAHADEHAEEPAIVAAMVANAGHGTAIQVNPPHHPS